MNVTLPLRTTSAIKIPLYLAPAFTTTSFTSSAARSFSSTTCNHARQRRAPVQSQRAPRDMNRKRAVSAMRSTGTRWSLSVDTHYEELPVPRPDSERPLDEFPINEKHGLYGFFNKEKQVVLPDEAEDTHGRSWKYRELMNKSFEELHQLYWACILEGNRIATRYGEHKRMKLAYGQLENRNRANTVQKTMNNIRSVLRDRQSAYDEAQILLTQKTIREMLEPKESIFESTISEDFVTQQSTANESSVPPSQTSSATGQPVQSRKGVLGPRPED